MTSDDVVSPPTTGKRPPRDSVVGNAIHVGGEAWSRPRHSVDEQAPASRPPKQARVAEVGPLQGPNPRARPVASRPAEQ